MQIHPNMKRINRSLGPLYTTGRHYSTLAKEMIIRKVSQSS